MDINWAAWNQAEKIASETVRLVQDEKLKTPVRAEIQAYQGLKNCMTEVSESAQFNIWNYYITSCYLRNLEAESDDPLVSELFTSLYAKRAMFDLIAYGGFKASDNVLDDAFQETKQRMKVSLGLWFQKETRQLLAKELGLWLGKGPEEDYKINLQKWK